MWFKISNNLCDHTEKMLSKHIFLCLQLVKNDFSWMLRLYIAFIFFLINFFLSIMVKNSSWAISNPKDDAVKGLCSICQQIWKTQQWSFQDRKRSVFIPIPKKGNAKECSNYRTIALISHTSKVMPQNP